MERTETRELLLRLQGDNVAPGGGMMDFLRQVAGEEQP